MVENKQRACDELQALTAKYPLNKIFNQYYLHFCLLNSNIKNEEVFQRFYQYHDYVIKTQNRQGTELVEIISIGVKVFYRLIEHNQYELASTLRTSLENLPNLRDDSHLLNIVLALKYFAKQSEVTFEQHQASTSEIKAEIQRITEESSKKGFEQLVIFTAIITFVITAAGSIMSNPVQLWALAGLGSTLITFVLCVLLFLDRPKFSELLTDFRFYVLAISASVTIWIATVATVATVATTDRIAIDCLIDCSYSLNVDSSFSDPKHEENYPLPPWQLQDKK